MKERDGAKETERIISGGREGCQRERRDVGRNNAGLGVRKERKLRQRRVMQEEGRLRPKIWEICRRGVRKLGKSEEGNKSKGGRERREGG